VAALFWNHATDFEPDGEVTAVVRARLPLPPRSKIRIRTIDGRAGVAALRDASADVVVLDAFAGGRVPRELTTVEFLTDVGRVLRPTGVFVANVADGLSLAYSRRLAATVRTVLPQVLVSTTGGKGRFGNVVIAGARRGLPVAEVRRAAAAAAFPRSTRLDLGRDARPLRDDDSLRSPAPPEEIWRVGD
jgi:spermidine synthase